MDPRLINNILDLQDIVDGVDDEYNTPPMFNAFRVMAAMLNNNMIDILQQSRTQLDLFSCIEYLENDKTCTEECCICFESLSEKDTIICKLPCNHTFHIGCIEPWLNINTTCPKCRFCLLEHSKSNSVKI